MSSFQHTCIVFFNNKMKKKVVRFRKSLELKKYQYIKSHIHPPKYNKPILPS